MILWRRFRTHKDFYIFIIISKIILRSSIHSTVRPILGPENNAVAFRAQ